MPVDTQEILDAAAKLGDLVAQHPAVAKYKQAQKLVAEDPDASRLLADFDRQLETLGRQEQSGMPVTDAQRQQLESLQSRIVSHIKVKSLNMAQVDFIDLLRKVNQTIQRPLQEAPQQPASPGGPRLTGMPRQ
ncbi:MAG TPA: YlbF family regulator [Tepidisphaeraceae bacterium]|jgi:cell fate (sporulation/competence/biofilm development) regulator YlbF (YheA/YmcA/DUF963 family)